MQSELANNFQKPGGPVIQAPGFFRRIAAITYDLLLLLALFFLATALVLPFNAGQAFSSQQYFYSLYLLSVSFVFYGWFWTHGGQTLGMRAWKIRLVSEQGSSVSWPQAGLRFLSAMLSWACLGMGFWWALFDKRKACWHDYLSKTRCVTIASEIRQN